MKNLFIIFALLMLISACKKEDLPGDASILSFTVDQISRESLTLDQANIDEPGKTIVILFSDNLPVDSFPISLKANYTITPGATALPASGEMLSFNAIDDLAYYTVTAENGDEVEYKVFLRGNQIPNAGFEEWYIAAGLNALPYKEPGLTALTTVWATANNGTSIYGVYCTTPLVDGDNTLAQITTKETLTVPVTAGTLFTGKFSTQAAIDNPTDPNKAVDFGIPFSLRPTSMKFKYTYQPGARYVKATLNNPGNIFGGFTIEDIEGEDSFTAWATLEVRSGESVTEIGRAEIVSNDTQLTFTELTVPFVYTSAVKPTHISIVFTSSEAGDLWTGAVGSVLTIDDLELVY